MPCNACHKEHPRHIRCEVWARQNAAPQDRVLSAKVGDHVATVPSPEVAAPIKKVQEFLKKVGRPRVYADPLKRRRERHRKWIREDRARKRAKVLGDDNKAVGIKSVPE